MTAVVPHILGGGLVSYVAYGGGTDSTGMLVELVRRGERIDLVMFADTGGERPETYAYVDVFSQWLVEHGAPAVTIVRHTRRDGSWESLEDECLRIKALPSLAYGWKKCSGKFKREPQEKFLNHWPAARAAWARGEQVVRIIGYDIDERRRADRQKPDDKYTYRYPLIEWGWDRAACRAAIADARLPMPGKSACFFCPASKKSEILSLPADLRARAIAMEDNAQGTLTTVRGLGRRFAWRDLIAADEAQSKLFPEPPEMACECVDGNDDEDGE